MHRRNAAERDIIISNNHFKAGLVTTDESFWYRILPQACNNLNLTRNSIINPNMSEEAKLNGAFD